MSLEVGCVPAQSVIGCSCQQWGEEQSRMSMIFVFATLYGGMNIEESATVTNTYICRVPKILTKNIQKTRSPCCCYAEILPRGFSSFCRKPNILRLIIIQWTYFEGNYNNNLQPQKCNICLVVMRAARELEHRTIQ